MLSKFFRFLAVLGQLGEDEVQRDAAQRVGRHESVHGVAYLSLVRPVRRGLRPHLFSMKGARIEQSGPGSDRNGLSRVLVSRLLHGLLAVLGLRVLELWRALRVPRPAVRARLHYLCAFAL